MKARANWSAEWRGSAKKRVGPLVALVLTGVCVTFNPGIYLRSTGKYRTYRTEQQLVMAEILKAKP